MNSPNLVPDHWNEPVITFNTFSTRQEEIEYIVEQINENITHDGLKLSRDLLIVVLGNYKEARSIEILVANKLKEREINFYIPSACAENDLNPKYPNKDPNKFWHDNAVTFLVFTEQREMRQTWFML